MKRIISKRQIILLITLLLALVISQAAFAESETDSGIRLVSYEGSINVEDEEGEPAALMEEVSLRSGESLSTEKDSMAVICLADGRTLTLDEESCVKFTQQGEDLELDLTKGSLFLDVLDKLEEEESLQIRTPEMTVGIRGTIVFLTEDSGQDSGGVKTTLGVLEGTAEVAYNDPAGAGRTIPVSAGNKLVLKEPDTSGAAAGVAPENGAAASAQAVVPEMSSLTADDIKGFVQEQIMEDPSRMERIRNASDILENTQDSFSEDGDWTWDQPVTLVAQSASKLYDGTPLTRRSDVLVYGLPTGFSITAAAGGSQTDAGTANNPVSRYTIYNSHGEDVTSHFKKIETVDGKLRVDPAPLTIWTASAEKVYDGTPLTEPETQVRTVPGYEAGEPLWRDTAYVQTASAGTEVLYGVCGTTWVHGTNPLTEEVREIELPAGKKLTVYLNDEDGKQSIEFRIEDITEEEIPEELLRLYADNPDLRAQACRDTGWDEESIVKRIDELEEDNSPKTEQSDLTINESATDRLMQDSTNVRIHIDTTITNYNGRALGNEEALYTPVRIDPSIQITATGSQKEAGQSPNTYEIDWGSANPNNYVMEEELGTLTVEPAPLTVRTGSAKKAYDGKPLRDEEASLTGLVNGETAEVKATGSITETGSAVNTYTIAWGTAVSANYQIREELGTLTVTKQKKPEDKVVLKAGSAEKVYDGTALTKPGVKASGLPKGYTVSATVSGSQTDAGSSANKITSYTIRDGSGKDVTSKFKNVVLKKGTLTVKPLPVEFDLCGYETEYFGYPVVPEWVYGWYGPEDEVESGKEPQFIEDEENDALSAVFFFTLRGGGQIEMTFAGCKDVGTYTLNPTVVFSSGNEKNYKLTYTNTDLVITQTQITLKPDCKARLVEEGETEITDYSLTVTPDADSVKPAGNGDPSAFIVSVLNGTVTVHMETAEQSEDRIVMKCVVDSSTIQEKNCVITLEDQEISIDPEEGIHLEGTSAEETPEDDNGEDPDGVTPESGPEEGEDGNPQAETGKETTGQTEAGEQTETGEQAKNGEEAAVQPKAGKEGGEQAEAGNETDEKAKAGKEGGEQAEAGNETDEKAKAGKEGGEQADAGKEGGEQADAAKETEENVKAGKKTGEKAKKTGKNSKRRKKSKKGSKRRKKKEKKSGHSRKQGKNRKSRRKNG